MTDYPEHKIVIECNGPAKDELVPLLQELEFMGNAGSSRTIHIEDWGDENDYFGFDGDGPSRITKIEVDGSEPPKRGKEAMDLQDQLVKLGQKNKNLRPHIRPVLDALKQASRPYTGYSVNELQRMLWDATSQPGIDSTYMDNLIHDLRAHGVSEHAIDSIIRQSKPGKPYPSRLDRASSQKVAAQMYSYDDLVAGLAMAAQNEGRFYQNRDAKGAVDAAAKTVQSQFFRDLRDAKRDAIREVERVWGDWDR